MTPREQIVAKCKEVFSIASRLYPHLDFSNVGIRFDLKGRAAGMACRRRDNMYVRFNTDMMAREAFNHVLNDTVPHEIAHIVCFMDPRQGNGHNSGWATVCRRLGGSGTRTHSEEVVYGKGTTYEYTTDRGHKVRVSDKIHRKIQNGVVYRWRQGKGTVNQMCAYSIVGSQGRSYVEPVHVNAPNHPAEIEAAIHTPPLSIPRPPTTESLLAGESKAAVSRRIMLSGYRGGHGYEEIISAMITACGYNRQLARATFKANSAKVGIPDSFA